MNGRSANEENLTAGRAGTTRLVGSPLPVGGGGRAPLSARPDAPQGIQMPQPGRSGAADELTSSVQKAVVALRNAFPVLQKILPMMDSQSSSSVASYLTTPPAAMQAPSSSLVPIEGHLVELRAHHRELRTQVQEQNTAIKRVEDQLEMVREATDRNTLEQQELMQDLKTVGTKVNFFAVVVLLLLAGSVLLNILLYLHISRILP
jgi:hypothetical protein